MNEKILVPLDGSDVAEIVIPYVEEFAVKMGAEVTLVSVSESTVVETDRLYRSYLELMVGQVRRELKELGAEKQIKVGYEVLTGRPVPEILRFAEENNMSLIAVSGRGHSGRDTGVLGGVATKVLRAATKPVFLVRTAAGDDALQQKGLVKRILVPLDGSEVGMAAIPYVELLAKALGAEMVLFHVMVEPVPVIVAPGVEFAYMPVMSREEEGRRATAAMGYLSGLGEALEKEGLKTSSEVSSGSTAGEIIKYAEDNAVDLIAMSTHGRSGIGRWVFGSITAKVLTAGNTPLFVVRAKQE